MWATFGGAGLGLAIGGPLGALIGALAGHFLVDAEGAPLRPSSRDTVFMTGLIALSAKMAKADGVVTRDEVSAFRSLVIVPEDGIARVQALFDLAKETTHGYEAYARQIADLYANEPMLREDVLDGLFHIAKADGAVHEAEYAYLKHVASIFGFDNLAFERIAARHVRLKNDPYLVLGANREMDDKTIKAHYRRLVADIHPDKEIARGLPPEAVSIATTRLAAVNAAWEQVKQERGLT
jgi:DnaJ like chaperone protein